MSRNFQKKDKDLANLKVLTANQVWSVNKNNRPVLNRNLKIFGKVEVGNSSFVTSTNLSGNNHKFVEDTCNLPKKVKNEVVDNFKNKNRRVVYLVEK